MANSPSPQTQIRTLARKFVKNDDYDSLHEAGRLIASAHISDRAQMFVWYEQAISKHAPVLSEYARCMSTIRTQVKMFLEPAKE